MRPACAWTASVLGLGLAACQPLPEIEYETERLRLGTDFEAPVCAGTLATLDRVAGRIDAALTPGGKGDPYVIYWLEHELQEHCDEDASGCFYPGTRVVFAHASSIGHELVHATIDSPGEGFFVEEGIAELYGGTAIRNDPSQLRGRLDAQLRLSRRDYRHGAVSYPEAAHFAHWLYEVEGVGALQRLATALVDGGEHDLLRRQLEGIFGLTVGAIEERYEDEARGLYRGVYDDDYETIPLPASGRWLTMDLDCGDAEVYGPLPGAEEGMARIVALRVEERHTVRLAAEGDASTWVELIDPYEVSGYASLPWWPRPGDRSPLRRVRSGEAISMSLPRGIYLLVFATEGTTPRTAELLLERLD